MPEATDTSLLQRVRAIMPDLQIERFERDHEGLINDVLIVNHSLVFRFAKTEEYARLLQVEVKLLDLVRPQLDRYLPRARFYAQLLELEWVLRGFESGEKFWFTVHLGNARDILV